MGKKTTNPHYECFGTQVFRNYRLKNPTSIQPISILEPSMATAIQRGEGGGRKEEGGREGGRKGGGGRRREEEGGGGRRGGGGGRRGGGGGGRAEEQRES